VQLAARAFLRAGGFARHLDRVRELYARRLDLLLDALERHFDPAWGARWTRPQGGLFVWVVLPPWMDARVLLELALREYHVAFVVGDAFHADGSGRNTLRLSFSCASPERIEEGVLRLARAIAHLARDRGPTESVGALPGAVPVAWDGAWTDVAWSLATAQTYD
jgi:DNA-binding transcriptional MocR family regulator